MPEEPSKPQSWWQTLPGILTAVAALITAVTGLLAALNQAGVLPRRSSTVSTSPTPSTTLSAGTLGEPAVGVVVSVNELEQRLKAANIMLSTGKPGDRERVEDTSLVRNLLINCWLSVAFSLSGINASRKPGIWT